MSDLKLLQKSFYQAGVWNYNSLVHTYTYMAYQDELIFGFSSWCAQFERTRQRLIRDCNTLSLYGGYINFSWVENYLTFVNWKLARWKILDLNILDKKTHDLCFFFFRKKGWNKSCWKITFQNSRKN